MRHFRAGDPYWSRPDGKGLKVVYPVVEINQGWERVFALATSPEDQREIIDVMTKSSAPAYDCDHGGIEEDLDFHDWDWGDDPISNSIPKFAEDFVYEEGDRP